jgi:hypothetical protein
MPIVFYSWTNSIPAGKKIMNKEETEELCGLMGKLQVKAKQSQVKCDTVAIALKDSFA